MKVTIELTERQAEILEKLLQGYLNACEVKNQRYRIVERIFDKIVYVNRKLGRNEQGLDGILPKRIS